VNLKHSLHSRESLPKNQGRDIKNTIVLFVLLMIAFAGQCSAQNTPAKDLFASKCTLCHGPDGSAQTTMAKSLNSRLSFF